MNSFYNFFWKKNFKFNKKVFVESNGENHQEMFDGYTNEVYKKGGAILMAVCRGRVSEGLDFKDELCRCVMIIAPPLASFVDPKVLIKQE